MSRVLITGSADGLGLLDYCAALTGTALPARTAR